MYASGVRQLPYYWTVYPYRNGATLASATDPVTTYSQYDAEAVPGFHYEGL